MNSSTSFSLLQQLNDPGNQVAWERFVDQYGPRIYCWCKHWGLQEADAEDVTQSLVLKLFNKLKDFQYEPSRGRFRSWLKTITRNALRDFSNHKKTHANATGDSRVWQRLCDEPAREDFVQRIEREFDLELLDAAKEQVKARVASHTWQAFELMEEQSMTVDDVAEQVGMQPAMVYVARSKVKRMLKEVLAEIRESVG